ncbi:MAG: Holliday junction branch migration protein RuvA [Syntrophomonadaceae bacterium]|jgi:Holliday junction DNA helicase RuvA
MISFIKGIIAETRNDAAVIDVNGVGYEIIMFPRAIARLPGKGEFVFLHTHLQVLENQFKLYGFLEKEEYQLFQQLLDISGMGARSALNILDFIEPSGFYQAIASQDEKLLIKIPGIGKKSASRLIFELKDKIRSEQLSTNISASGDNNLNDVFEALEALGYGRSEIFPLAMEMQARGELTGSVEQKLKKILKARGLMTRS